MESEPVAEENEPDQALINIPNRLLNTLMPHGFTSELILHGLAAKPGLVVLFCS
jgi:hypothetical protein